MVVFTNQDARMFGLSILSLVVILEMGCSPCKSLCDDMADFASSDECNFTVTTDMIAECKEEQGEKTKEDRQDCRQVRPTLEEEWDCEELEIYFSDDGTQVDDSNSN